ncbi:MAG: methyl-accepting chemotaxis protein [Gallionella sp.]|jgi:twitching motility protein PilJ|nr:methyl-accepting chemotaxis protein [Gallionella sp.]
MATEQKTLKTKAQTGKKSRSAFKLPLIGHLPIAQQLKYLGAATGLVLILAAVAAYINNREESNRAGYVLQAAKLELYAHQLNNAATLAASGDSKVFDELSAVSKSLAESAQILDKGNASLPATSGRARAILEPTLVTVKKILADADSLHAGRAGLVTLNRSIDAVSLGDADFRLLSDQLTAAVGRELSSTFQLAIERIARDTAVLLSTQVDMEEMARLGVDTYMAETALAAMPAANPVVQRAAELFEPYRLSVEIMVGESRSFVEAKVALAEIEQATNQLIKQSNELRSAYETSVLAIVSGWSAVVFGLLMAALLLLIFKEYLEDSRQQAQRAEATNRQNQEAILRLMNELSDLADGDLTIRATVSEDITGAIADSVNYTTEELRKLVTGITKASEKMGLATGNADTVSQSLLVATQRQANEIREAEESVQLMAKSIQEVDASATKATEVGRRTLVATEQGAQAVRNSIAGMDGIREQIQDTAKRIKRLGESSQEIGEIVDLISDITEQTNVLALNAAIQAASAGEAGRGFSVVAEEVQRLAERSGEATKQIGALVKTIQSDTYDAVAAMEKSTLGVVEGAKLSDVAGQSLREIEQVSNELARLINSISVTTQVQTDMVGEVSDVMKEVLNITQQTTEGTRMTAQSIVQLTALAAELKGSVAGFKVQS